MNIRSPSRASVDSEGGRIEAQLKLRAGWNYLREIFKSWGVQTPADLANWMAAAGLSRVRPHDYIIESVQEYISNRAVQEDIQVCGMESACMSIAVA